MIHFRPLIFLLLAAFSSAHAAETTLRLIVWQPSPQHAAFVLPARTGESDREAVTHYLQAIHRNFNLNALFGAELGTGGGRVEDFPSPLEAKRPTALILANSKKDMAAEPFRLRNNMKLLSERGLRSFVLPIASQIALTSRQQREAYFALLLAATSGAVDLGGSDVDASLYGGDPELSTDTVLERDVLAAEVLRYLILNGSLRGNYFIAAFCRAMQEIAVLSGYQLDQQLSLNDKSLQHSHPEGFGNGDFPKQVWHEISIDPASYLYTWVGESKIRVNSIHRQAVSSRLYLAEALLPLKFVAFAPDETREAAQAAGLALLQFHPEIMALDGDSVGRAIMDGIANSIRAIWQTRHCVDSLRPVNGGSLVHAF